jgi:hypothetical protein
MGVVCTHDGRTDARTMGRKHALVRINYAHAHAHAHTHTRARARPHTKTNMHTTTHGRACDRFVRLCEHQPWHQARHRQSKHRHGQISMHECRRTDAHTATGLHRLVPSVAPGPCVRALWSPQAKGLWDCNLRRTLRNLRQCCCAITMCDWR